MYLAAIIDWYSRYIMSWELSQSLERSFVLRALRKALATRKPEIINSDQGAHFTCGDYIELLKENGVKISMGRGGADDFLDLFTHSQGFACIPSDFSHPATS